MRQKNPTSLPKELLKNRVHLPIEPKVTELLKELRKKHKKQIWMKFLNRPTESTLLKT